MYLTNYQSELGYWGEQATNRCSGAQSNPSTSKLPSDLLCERREFRQGIAMRGHTLLDFSFRDFNLAADKFSQKDGHAASVLLAVKAWPLLTALERFVAAVTRARVELLAFDIGLSGHIVQVGLQKHGASGEEDDSKMREETTSNNEQACDKTGASEGEVLTPDQQQCVTIVTEANRRFRALRGMELMWETIIANKKLLLEASQDETLFPHPSQDHCKGDAKCADQMRDERAFDLENVTYSVAFEDTTRSDIQNNLHRACTVALCRGRAYPHDASACFHATEPRSPFH